MKHEAAFNNLVTHILKWEGGAVNDPDDRGGKTNKGVTWNTYQGLAQTVLGNPPSQQQFDNLTNEQVNKFILHFWNAVNANKINSSLIACFVTEMGWGSGPGTAIKTVQNTLNRYFGYNLTVDGGNGPKTLAAINAVDPNLLFNYLVREREAFLKRLAQNPTQLKFLKGWLNRVTDFVQQHDKFIIGAAGGFGLLVLGIALYLYFKKD
jgi:lysozyme family protein